MNYCFALRSQNFGHGKTWAGVSFKRPGIEPKRLVYDWELRAEVYRGTEDEPSRGKFKFHYWPPDAIEGLLSFADQIKNSEFDYNVVVFDGATMFQEQLKAFTQTQQSASKLARAFNCDYALGNRKFNPNDTASFYYFLKAIIKSMLRMFRANGIDVIITAESRNVWENYGMRGRDPRTGEPYMKILGQTLKLWDPWIQMSDAIFVLSREIGSRDDGTAEISTFPIATIDTFNPKASIPGLMPKFEFRDWSVVWEMIERGRGVTAADFKKVGVPTSEYPDEEELTIDDAKIVIFNYAVEMGVIPDKSTGSLKKLADLGKEAGLDPKNLLQDYQKWIEVINEQG